MAPELNSRYRGLEYDNSGVRKPGRVPCRCFWSSFVSYERLFNPLTMLARPGPFEQTGHIQPSSKSRSPSALECLPAELLDMIMCYLSSQKLDLMAVGLCSVQLWHIALRSVYTHYLAIAAPLAGKCIALLSQWDWPIPGPFRDPCCFSALGLLHAEEHEFIYELPHEQPVESEEEVWIAAARTHKKRCQISESRWSSLEKQLKYTAYFPADQSWTLRNLTTREFVCADALAGETNEADNQHAGKLTSLQDVLLMRISCFSELHCHHRNLGPSEGPWAGHRFDIVRTEEHRAAQIAEGWHDVSAAALEEVSAVRIKVQGPRRASH